MKNTSKTKQIFCKFRALYCANVLSPHICDILENSRLYAPDFTEVNDADGGDSHLSEAKMKLLRK